MKTVFKMTVKSALLMSLVAIVLANCFEKSSF